MSTEPQFLVNGLIAGAHYAIIGVGFSLVGATSRTLPLYLVLAYTGSAYGVYICSERMHVSVTGCMLPVLVIVMLLGALLDSVCYKRIREHNAPSSSALLCSLGLIVAFQSGVSLLFGDEVSVYRGSSEAHIISLLGVRFTHPQLAMVLVMISIGLLAPFIQRYSRWGRIQRALATDVELSTIIGIRADVVFAVVAAIGCGVAGIAGILHGIDADLTPTMGFTALLMGMTASLVGGMRSLAGAILGGLVVGLVQQIGVIWLAAKWQDAIVYAFLLCLLLLRPCGIIGHSTSSTQL